MKYLRLYIAFFRASLTADMEFRANFVIKLTTEMFWYVSQVASFSVIYRHTNTIAGWTWPEMRVFLSILFLVDSLYMVTVANSLDTLSDLVRKGGLDLLLTKPVDSQFMISLQRAATPNILTTLLTSGWLVWSLAQLENFSWTRALWLIIAVPSGSLIFYCLRFMFAATAVIFTKVESLNYLWYNFYRLGLRPDTIYVPWMKLILLSIVPVGLIASVPARLVLGLASGWMALWLVGVASLCLYLSHRFWRFTLRHYTSASS
jgi:ABC-2 type transport system permease protein